MTFAQPFSGYEILERVGSGAMGTVFKARDKKLDRIVALKVLRPSLARDERYVERLRREARIVTALDDPNIVAGFDVGEEGGYHFFVMEFIAGRSLRELLAEWGMFPQEQVLDVATQVTRALDHAFEQGVIHRDIKPGNILITEDNQVKLTDMGLAKGPTDLTITRDGATVGTPQYISPEQARNPQEADIRSDLYSLGATLYHMLTGSPPFTGDTMAEVITKVLHERAPSVAGLNPAVSDGISLVIRRLLAKDPELRYQTPAELLEDLRRVERDEAPRVDVKKLAQAEAGTRARRRVWGAAAVGAGLVVVVAGGYALWGPSDIAADTTERFRAQLTERLGGAATYRDKLRALLEAPIESESERAVVAEARAELYEDIRAALDDLFARELSAPTAEQWFEAPQNWRDPERFFAAFAEPAIEAKLGLHSIALPASLRHHLGRLQNRHRESMGEWVRARDARYRRSFGDYLVRVFPAVWAGELASGDFAAAVRAVREGLNAFFEGDGMPSREQLPDELRRWVAGRERRAVQDAMVRIDSEETQAAADLRRQVQDAITELEGRRRTLPAGRLVELLDGVRRELEVHPAPQCFRPAHNPWREVDGTLRRFEEVVEADLRLEEAENLDHAVGRAYRTLVSSGDIQDAIGWIAHLQLDNADNREIRDAHVDLLAAARDIEVRVCEALLDGQPSRRVRVRRAADPSGTKQVVELRRTADGFVWAVVGAGDENREPLHASTLYWPDLLAALSGSDWLAAADDADRSRLQEGLALWLFVSGDDVAGTMKLLAENRREFFTNAVTGPVDRARERADTDVSELALLEEVRRAFEGEQRILAEVEAAVDRFRTRYGAQVRAEDARYLGKVESWIESERDRVAQENRLRVNVGAGVGVVVAEDRTVTLMFPPLAIVEAGLPEGWTADRAELVFSAFDVDLQAARGEAGLVLMTAMDQVTDVTLEVPVRFPELRDRHRLYLFELHGMVAAVGLLRDGTVAAVVGTDGLLDRADELRRRLQKALESASGEDGLRVVPEASYRMTLRVVGDRKRQRVTASLEDVELASHTVRRPAPAANRARIMPLQPLRIGPVVLRGH